MTCSCHAGFSREVGRCSSEQQSWSRQRVRGSNSTAQQGALALLPRGVDSHRSSHPADASHRALLQMGQVLKRRSRRRIRNTQPLAICRIRPADVVSGGDLPVSHVARLPTHRLTFAMPVGIRPFVPGLIPLPRTSETGNSFRRFLTPCRNCAPDLIPYLFNHLCLAGGRQAALTGPLEHAARGRVLLMLGGSEPQRSFGG